MASNNFEICRTECQSKLLNGLTTATKNKDTKHCIPYEQERHAAYLSLDTYGKISDDCVRFAAHSAFINFCLLKGMGLHLQQLHQLRAVRLCRTAAKSGSGFVVVEIKIA